MWQSICEQINAITGKDFVIQTKQSIGGGSINTAYLVSGGSQSYFVKTNAASRLEMFEAELDGLKEIAGTNAIKVPEAICTGSAKGGSYIVMEYLKIHGHSGGQASMVQLAEDLADMHRHTQKQYGWHRDNTIGSTTQINRPSSDWIEFYRQHRLAFQYQLAAEHGHRRLLQRGELLLSNLDNFFTGYNPPPSLLHGDLWSGNYAIDDRGIPVIFDPAPYYGDREADIAMTELFGGFSSAFYSAYNASYPLDVGYKTRKILYNLYHILNHLNLFGGGYLGQAERMTDQLLSEL